MIRTGLIAIVLSLILHSCNGQINKEKNQDKNLNSPQTNIKVNKQYDKNGNLIRYDSTYSYYYSNIKNDTSLRDSIFNNFKSHFNQKYFFSDEPFFNHSFFEDSLLKYDFYKYDFFLNRFRRNMERMDSLFWGMDSVKNEFFNKQFRTPAPLKAPKKTMHL
jgi:hypothetical protein